jgi:hypothetical protein
LFIITDAQEVALRDILDRWTNPDDPSGELEKAIREKMLPAIAMLRGMTITVTENAVQVATDEGNVLDIITEDGGITFTGSVDDPISSDGGTSGFDNDPTPTGVSP